jgi:hypothetical protein
MRGCMNQTDVDREFHRMLYGVRGPDGFLTHDGSLSDLVPIIREINEADPGYPEFLRIEANKSVIRQGRPDLVV